MSPSGLVRGTRLPLSATTRATRTSPRTRRRTSRRRNSSSHSSRLPSSSTTTHRNSIRNHQSHSPKRLIAQLSVRIQSLEMWRKTILSSIQPISTKYSPTTWGISNPTTTILPLSCPKLMASRMCLRIQRRLIKTY